MNWIEQLKAEGFTLEHVDFYRVRRGDYPGYTTHWYCYEGHAWAEARKHRNLNRRADHWAI